MPGQPPAVIRRLFPGMTWHFSRKENIIFLTFDDGPVPEVTPWVLDQLNKFNAKATFFCVGENVEKHPDIYQRILDQGHAVGNHTHHHLNGLSYSNNNYFEDVEKAGKLIKSKLFRPPYGRLKLSQYNYLKKHYQLVMWDVLSFDYDKTKTPEQCKEIVLNSTKPGSVIVFHDSVKAAPRLMNLLTEYLDIYSNRGYKFEAISFSLT